MIIIQIAGRLGKDPETRFTPSGLKVTTLVVATEPRKSGKTEETVWWRVTVWGDRFDKMMTYLKKGSAVIIVGEMQKPEIYNDKEGRPQVSMQLTAEMIRFSPFGNPERSQEQNANSAQNHNQNSQQGSSQPYNSQQTHTFSAPAQSENNYAGFSSGGQAGMNAGYSQDTEDSLPF